MWIALGRRRKNSLDLFRYIFLLLSQKWLLKKYKKLKSNESNFCVQVHLNGSDHNVCVGSVSVSMNPLRILNCT